MKKLFSIIFILFSATAIAQNVGIGEIEPTEMKLQVKSADSAVLLLQNSTTTGSDNKTGLFYKIGNYYSGSIATIGSGATFRMGLSTYGGVSPSGLIERISILDGGNVGIGTTNPTAKLEVAGTLKIADGTQAAGNVLTSDAAGNASWTSIGNQYGYKKCKQITAKGAGSFTVPAGVTEIMVEAWGAGSGAVIGDIDVSYGGTSGGYVRTVQSVTPGAILTYTVGAGSADALKNVNLTAGGTTTFNFSNGYIQALGGGGHSSGSANPGEPNSGTGTVDNFVALYGNTGNSPVFEFGQKSASIYTQIIHWGNGGKAVGLTDANVQRGYTVYYENGVIIRSYNESFAVYKFPSSGAFSSMTGSNGGGSGMLLIWYN